MRKHLLLSAAAVLVVGANAAAAEGPSYNFGQGGLLVSSSKLTGDRETGLGIGIGGEAEIWKFVYGFVNVGTVKYSLNGGDITITPASLGAGAHMSLGAVDLFGGLSLERLKVKVNPDGPGGYSVSDSGPGLTVGVRGVLMENIQWSGSLKYADLGDFDDVTTLGVSGHYYFKPNMAVGINLARTEYDGGGADGETSVFFNFRYDFSGMR